MKMLKNVKYALGKSQLLSPISLILFVTNRCNSFCKTCFYWQNLNTPDELTIDEIKKISSSMDKLVWLAIGGGEPFLRNDLAEICGIFVRTNKVESLSIPTNGLLPERISKITERIISSTGINVEISLSLDGIGEIHDEIRGVKGCFSKVLETAELLNQLKTKHPNLTTKVCTVISNKNYRELRQIGEFVKNNLQIDFHGCELIRGNPKDPEFSPPPVEALDNVMNDIMTIYSAYFFNPNYSYLESKLAVGLKKYILNKNIDLLKGRGKIIPCYAGAINGVIYPNGEVAFCELKPSIGNLRDYDFDFKQLWNSEKSRKIIKETTKNCTCTHSCFQNTNVMFNPWEYPKVISLAFRGKKNTAC